MTLFFLLFFNGAFINTCDPIKHASILFRHTNLQFKSLFTPNVGKLLDELSRHDIQCHRNPSSMYQKLLLPSNKKLLKRISQSDSDFKESSISSSLLFNYVIWGLPERVNLALKEGFNPNAIDEKGNTPIIYALDQYMHNIEQQNAEKSANFKIIIQDLLHHGSITFGNSKFNCPFTFAKNNNLHDCLHLFDEIKNRRIQKISDYLQKNGCQKVEADYIGEKIITEQVDWMTLSSQEQNVLIVKNLYGQWIDR